MDAGKILERLVQVGTVTDVNQSKRLARVKFQNTGIPSGWLHILQRGGGALSLTPDSTDQHCHAGSVTAVWLPRVNDTVLVLYLPVKDSDGIILGGM